MVEVLEFIFGSVWRFFGTCLLLGIATQWAPVQIVHRTVFQKGAEWIKTKADQPEP